jgi:protein-disulfide isomerase
MKINLPISILLIGLIVSGGIFFSRLETTQKIEEPEQIVVEFSPITSEDNIFGNPTAPIKIVEYSDFSCPFCSDFHSVMESVMERYGKSGEVAWIYRHVFSPVPENQGPRLAALASECVKNIATQNKMAFWDYAKLIFENTPDSLTQEGLLEIGEEMNVNSDELAICIGSERYAPKIERNIEDVKNIAETYEDQNIGTPYVLVTSDSGLQVQLIGNTSYEEIINIVEVMLSQ